MINLYQQQDKNDDFFEAQKDHLNHTDLGVILEKSPAHWAYPDPEKKVTEAQEVGLASHIAILDEGQFLAKYARKPSPEDYPHALMNDTQMKAFLKDRGVKGYSTKKTPELIELVRMTGEAVLIFAEVEQDFFAEVGDKDALKAKDFDRITTMRRAIYSNDKYSDMLTGGSSGLTYMGELDVEGEMFKVKVSPDAITRHAQIVDYVTTTSAKPEDFGKNCINFNRLMKAALELDVVTQYYASQGQDVSFDSIILCQEKSYPYVPQAYRITEAQIEYGREKYTYALKYLTACQKEKIFPAYGNGIIDLTTPEWAGI